MAIKRSSPKIIKDQKKRQDLSDLKDSTNKQYHFEKFNPYRHHYNALSLYVFDKKGPSELGPTLSYLTSGKYKSKRNLIKDLMLTNYSKKTS